MSSGSDRSRLTRLGLALGRKRGRIFVGRRLQEVDNTDDHSRLRTAWSIVPATSEARPGDAERLDVGEQGVVAQDTPPFDRNVLFDAKEGLE